MYRRRGKRVVDVLLGGLALIILAPVLLGVGIVVWLCLGPPVLFRQRRPGLGGGTFELLKFRTMTQALDAEGGLRSDAERLTPFGRALRRSSLDELPEFLNVLRGDMSLVGPRPLLEQYLNRYSPEQARRHEVLPGITGWAQVNGRNALSWPDRLALDVWYVDHVSFWLDMRILARTLWSVMKREGTSAPGHATMDEFTGGPR